MNQSEQGMYRIKMTVMNASITLLILVVSLACTNSEDIVPAKTDSKVVLSTDQPDKKMPLPTFMIYGEKSPSDYLDGGEDALTLIHGFLVERVSGCEVTHELVKSVKANNNEANKQMIAQYGQSWKTDFEKETGKKLVYPH